MISLDFDWQTNEFMLYCRTTQLREKSMMAYEQSLKLFQRWCMDEMGIFTVDKVTENIIRRYIMELQERGKYTFYIVDKQKKTNYPERRRDYRKPISTATINNYIRNLRVFFNYLERNYIIKKNPMKKIRQLRTNCSINGHLSIIACCQRNLKSDFELHLLINRCIGNDVLNSVNFILNNRRTCSMGLSVMLLVLYESVKLLDKDIIDSCIAFILPEQIGCKANGLLNFFSCVCFILVYTGNSYPENNAIIQSRNIRISIFVRNNFHTHAIKYFFIWMLQNEQS